eukprot:SAG31_NODE_88_length_26714_cov_6.972046_18_plen_209_part_00
MLMGQGFKVVLKALGGFAFVCISFTDHFVTLLAKFKICHPLAPQPSQIHVNQIAQTRRYLPCSSITPLHCCRLPSSLSAAQRPLRRCQLLSSDVTIVSRRSFDLAVVAKRCRHVCHLRSSNCGSSLFKSHRLLHCHRWPAERIEVGRVPGTAILHTSLSLSLNSSESESESESESDSESELYLISKLLAPPLGSMYRGLLTSHAGAPL